MQFGKYLANISHKRKAGDERSQCQVLVGQEACETFVAWCEEVDPEVK